MKLVLNLVQYLLSISIIFSEVHTLNILGVFPYQGRSHFFVFQPYLLELAKRGHNVTIISHFPEKTHVNKYRDISLADSTKIYEAMLPIESSYLVQIGVIFLMVDAGTDNCRVLLANKEVQQLWKTNAKFDVIVLEQFTSDCALGLAHKLGAPVVGINSHVFMPFHFARFGIHYNPSFMPCQFLGGGTKPSLYQRVERTIFHTFVNIIHKYRSQYIDQNTLAEYFEDVPPLEELAKQIKIMLSYQNFMLHGSTLLPTNIKEVGGYHIATPQDLPADIKKYIDESEHGVIYISFGSMLKASTIPRDKLDAIIAALSELPQRVLWKWEEMSLPGNPQNIMFSKWLPQNDILAHSKVLAFYSHCGLLGTTEAIYHGVPMVGMPVFGDQPANAASMEESGLGVQIQINDLNKENLLEKLKTVLDPSFRNRVKKLSKAWHDRPVSAMDSAVYWTEFAATHRNFTFRSRSADVPLYQYFYVDVVLVLCSILVIVFYTTRTIFTLILSSICKVSKSKLKSN